MRPCPSSRPGLAFRAPSGGANGFEFEAPPKIDDYWIDGQTFKVGELEFKVLHCPGHTPGHVVLFERKGKEGLCWRRAFRRFSGQNGSARWLHRATDGFASQTNSATR